jgi:hypothetical protein
MHLSELHVQLVPDCVLLDGRQSGDENEEYELSWQSRCCACCVRSRCVNDDLVCVIVKLDTVIKAGFRTATASRC